MDVSREVITMIADITCIPEDEISLGLNLVEIGADDVNIDEVEIHLEDHFNLPSRYLGLIGEKKIENIILDIENYI